MSDNDIVLTVENLGKYFKIYPNPESRLKEWFKLGKRSYHKDFWALKDISFNVADGEFLGIIGPNGAGKSTLLKLITGVLNPSTGKYSTKGRVLSLLELSGGMDQDLSGRENIIRSAQLLGFPDGYVDERMDHIENFAELGDFFEKEMRTYSSGMKIRLAFSMFAFLECDILILDEILSVGDIFFKQKCFARLEELMKQNVSIILVTHSIAIVRQYCQQVIVLDKGKMVYYGDTGDGIKKYFSIRPNRGVKLRAEKTFDEDYLSNDDTALTDAVDTSPADSGMPLEWPELSEFNPEMLPEKSDNNKVELIQFALHNSQGTQTNIFHQGEVVTIYYAYKLKTDTGIPISKMSILTPRHLIVHSKDSIQLSIDPPRGLNKGDILRFRQSVKLDIAPGNYILKLKLSSLHPKDFEERDFYSRLEFKNKYAPLISINPAGAIEVISKKQNDPVGIHDGLCNLNGAMDVKLISADEN